MCCRTTKRCTLHHCRITIFPLFPFCPMLLPLSFFSSVYLAFPQLVLLLCPHSLSVKILFLSPVQNPVGHLRLRIDRSQGFYLRRQTRMHPDRSPNPWFQILSGAIQQATLTTPSHTLCHMVSENMAVR